MTKWNDKSDEPQSRSFFEQLFTTAGTGTFNMTDYFDTMSHGSIDLSGSQVFGWLVLDQPQSAYVGFGPAGPGQVDRSSIIMIGSNGQSDLVVGDSFSQGTELAFEGSFLSVRVDEINEHEHFATVTLTCRPRPMVPILVGDIFGGVAGDGGGYIVINGHPHPVDPQGPLRQVVEQVVAHATADLVADPIVRIDAKRSALRRIIRVPSEELEDLTGLETPPPPTRVDTRGQLAAKESSKLR